MSAQGKARVGRNSRGHAHLGLLVWARHQSQHRLPIVSSTTHDLITSMTAQKKKIMMDQMTKVDLLKHDSQFLVAVSRQRSSMALLALGTSVLKCVQKTELSCYVCLGV